MTTDFSKLPSRQRTFAVLSNSPSKTAMDCLRQSADATDPQTRRLAWKGLVRRPYSDAHHFLMKRWQRSWTEILEACHDERNLAGEQAVPHWAHQLAEAIVANGGDKERRSSSEIHTEALQLIEIAEMTGWPETITSLITLAIDSRNATVRHGAAATVLGLVGSLGRQTRGQSMVERARSPHHHCRRSLCKQLKQALELCVRRISLAELTVVDGIEAEDGGKLDVADFSETKLDATTGRLLADAFLALSTWQDGELHELLTKNRVTCELLAHRLTHSLNRSVIGLLTESLLRKHLPPVVTRVFHHRTDASFRDAWLDSVSPRPTTTMLSRVESEGLPPMLPAGRGGLPDRHRNHDAAIARLNVAAYPDDMETLALLICVLQRGGVGSREAVIEGLARCRPPSCSQWLAAALAIKPPAGQPNDQATAFVRESFGAGAHDGVAQTGLPTVARDGQILDALVGWSQGDDAALAGPSKKLLANFSMQDMLPTLGHLDADAQQRAGRLVMAVDASAVHWLQDQLRHPVLKQRMQAIDVIAALSLVDTFVEPLEHVALHDHQEARLRVAELMASADGEDSVRILRVLASSPQCSIRDAATASLESRGWSVVG